VLVVTLNAAEVAVHVEPEAGQERATEPKAVQFRLVLTAALGPQRVNVTDPVGAGAVARSSGAMLSVAVSVIEAPAVTVPVLLASVSSVVGWRTKKHSFSGEVLSTLG
jgi:hypothetical protein